MQASPMHLQAQQRPRPKNLSEVEFGQGKQVVGAPDCWDGIDVFNFYILNQTTMNALNDPRTIHP